MSEVIDWGTDGLSPEMRLRLIDVEAEEEARRRAQVTVKRLRREIGALRGHIAIMDMQINMLQDAMRRPPAKPPADAARDK